MMDPAKQAIFRRIQHAIGAHPENNAARNNLREKDWAAIPRGYRRAGTLGVQERIALFQSILQHYGATSYTCGLAQVAEMTGKVLRDRQKKRLVVAPELPQEWIPAGIEAVPDEGLSNEQLDKIDGVLTGCTVAIASTGTIVLSGSRDGRRGISLVPDYKLCIVREDQLVEFIAEALERLQPLRTTPLTFFSGPSATVDIEMTRVQGVHGPRTLDVVIAS